MFGRIFVFFCLFVFVCILLSLCLESYALLGLFCSFLARVSLVSFFCLTYLGGCWCRFAGLVFLSVCVLILLA